MTDKEIIKALECCLCDNSECLQCQNKELCRIECDELATKTIDLITRQQAIVEKSEKVEYFADKTIAKLQAENERLEVENQFLRGAANSLKMHYEKAQSEIDSLKIFRGYAKKRASDYRTMRDKYLNAKSEAVKEFAMKLKCGVPQETGVIRCSDIDNTLKEMVGENND